MHIRQLTNEEFNLFTDSFPLSSPYQTSEYAFVMNNQGFDAMHVGLIEDDNIIAASLLLIEKRFGFKYAYAPRGFLIDYKDTILLEQFTKLLKKFLGRKDIIAVKLAPMITKSVYNSKYEVLEENSYYENIFNTLKKLDYYHFGYNNSFESLKPRYEAIIDLARPYYLIFRDFKKEFRTKIRSAEKRFIQIIRGNENDLENLYFHTNKKYPRDLKYFQDCYKFYNKREMISFYYAKLNTEEYLKFVNSEVHRLANEVQHLNNLILMAKKENIKLINKKLAINNYYNDMKNNLIEATSLLRQYPNGLILASVLLNIQNDNVYVLMDGYDVKYKKFNAKHLLIWKLVEKFSKTNYKSFCLGGMTNIYFENNPFKGLNDFKLGFSPKVYEYIGDLELITNKPLYLTYKSTAPLRGILKK